MKQITLGSLFDGIGGWPLAAFHAGVKAVWASEIEKFPQAVTAARFPDMVQLGDITRIDGAEIEPVDIICMGSPCQDLSVAGRQKGLNGEKSGLFYKAVGIIQRMRTTTGGSTRDSSCGRMSPEHSAAIREWIFEPCSVRSQRPKFQCLNLADGHRPEWCEAKNVTLRGGYWMLNIGECPSGARESFLSQILQLAKDVPTKYYLSARACQGILRRAEKRGKELPAELREALIRQSQDFL